MLFDGTEQIIIGISSRTHSEVDQVAGHQKCSCRGRQDIGLASKRGRAFDLISKFWVEAHSYLGTSSVDDKA